MNEQDIRNIIKIGIKSPSLDFTDKVMKEVSIIKNEVPKVTLWNIRLLLSASFLLFIISIFVRLPAIEITNNTIRLSPMIMPIISLVFIFIVLNQLYDLRKSILDNKNITWHNK